MNSSSPARSFQVRHVQVSRAALAAIAAIMITFSPDHSAAVGLSVFSGFAFATGLIFALSAWLVYPAGHRWSAVLLAALSLLAGMIAGIPSMRSVVVYFVVVIAWAALTGFVEALSGWRVRRGTTQQTTAPDATAPDATAQDGSAHARDALVVGALGILLALALVFVPPQFALNYAIEKVGEFTLTGITIGVGIFGGYCAIIAVYLGIAGFSPRTPVLTATLEQEAQDA